MQRDISYLPILMHTLHKKITEAHDKVLTDFDLSKKHVPFLMLFTKYKDGMTQQEITEKLNLDKGHISRTLRDLEAKGYIEKLGDSSYKNVFVATHKSNQIKKVIKEENQKIINRVLDVLTEDEMKAFEMTIQKIMKAL
ncbi:MarR family transcriptional regulator [Mycoplasmatota bacterium]|nr:MarR family transcriptional regulator [Mycoplasmatota bacterium]